MRSKIGIVVLAVLFALPANASADDFDAYAGCGRAKSAPPSHRCEVGDKIGLFFRSNVGQVSFDVCVRFPAGQKLCSRAQLARPGVLAVNPVTSPKGRLVATWSVAGKVVGRWTLHVVKPPASRR